MTARPPPALDELPAFDRTLLAGAVLDAARALLGARLVRGGGDGVRVGRIVEVEAYAGPEDAASHARFGPTPRNAAMFGTPGHAYVYLVYGMHHCLNVVVGPAGTASAVLVRAVEPVAGVDAMRAAREARGRGRGRRHAPDARLAAGPGLVGDAFDVDRTMTGIDLCDPGSPLRLAAPAIGDAPAITAGPRVGIGYAGEPWASLPWRLYDAGSLSVSRPRS